MAAFARDVLTGPPPGWRSTEHAGAGQLAGADGGAAAEEAEVVDTEADASGEDDWAMLGWGGGLDADGGGDIDSGGAGGGASIGGEAARWTSAREWARPRGRERLFCERDGSGAERPAASRRALALAYYMVGFRAGREPAAFAWAVADDVLCREAADEAALTAGVGAPPRAAHVARHS